MEAKKLEISDWTGGDDRTGFYFIFVKNTCLDGLITVLFTHYSKDLGSFDGKVVLANKEGLLELEEKVKHNYILNSHDDYKFYESDYFVPAPDLNNKTEVIHTAWDIIDRFYDIVVKNIHDEAKQSLDPKPKDRYCIVQDLNNDAKEFWNGQGGDEWVRIVGDKDCVFIYASKRNAEYIKGILESSPHWSDKDYPEDAKHPVMFYKVDTLEEL